MRIVKSLTAALLVAAAPIAPALAQADSSFHGALFTWRDAVLAGAFTLGTIAARPLDKSAAHAMQQPAPQRNRVLRVTADIVRQIAVPGAVVIGGSMYAAGRLANNDRLAELGLFGTEALLVGGGSADVHKLVFGRARPYVDSVPNPDNWQLMRGLHGGPKYQSFPSGHSVAAFAAAAAVSSEVSRWYPNWIYAVGPAMYGGATMVALSRMYENRHWASDVITGAAIGTFAGIKVVRYHRTHHNKTFDRWLLNASVNPKDLTHVTFSLVPMLR
ncbi:MAG TPA: phosphatase PAP2 family protein [Gemmatimonadaceae bacterium]|nr:phosphatase PAP2 family protein [Gemmatimonadaceae bacterium]